ncbi:MAG: hypothetical protein VW338_04760 [Rhodospirillaceae bacterium]
MPVSPDTDNLYIGKGALYFTPDGGSEEHMGNAVSIEVGSEIEELEHFSSLSGVRSKDLVVVLSQSYTFTVQLEELTRQNVQRKLLGSTPALNTAGNYEFGIGASTKITGALRFAGANTYGNKFNIDCPNVQIRPGGTGIQLISNEFGVVELVIEALYSEANGNFGTVEILESETPSS